MAKASKPLTRTRRRQRGAAAVLGAVTAILGLIAVGLAVDLARLYAAQRSLQRIANVAALDASRIAGGCFGVAARGPNPLVSARDEARASLIRNGGNPSWIEGRGLVRLGQMRVDAAGVRQFDPVFDDEGVPIGAITAHDSVQVVLLRPTPPRLIPAFSRGDDAREMVAVASAMSRPIARFGVGSGVLGVDLSQSLLDPLLAQLLGSSPSLAVINYQNLLSAGLTLEALTGAFGDGDLGSLLTETLPASDLVGAIADLVEDATADLGGGLGELVGVDGDLVGVAGDLTVSVGELVSQAVRQVNEGVPITIACPDVLSVLGLNCSGGQITILDPGTPGAAGVPQGGGEGNESFATSGQVQISLPGVAINPLNASIVNLSADVDIIAASGRAQVQDIRCPRAGQPDPIVVLRPDTRLAQGRVLVTGQVSLPLSQLGIPNILGLLPPVLLGLSIDLPLTFPSGEQGMDLTFTLNDEHNRLTGEPSQRHPSNSELAIADALAEALNDMDVEITILNIGLLGPVINLLTDALLGNVIESLLAPILDPTLNNLLNNLGVQLAYADYRVFNVTDGQPVLFQR